MRETNWKGRAKRLEFKLKLAMNLMTKIQRKKLDEAYEDGYRERGRLRSRVTNRRAFKGHVPQAATQKAVGERIDVC